MFALLLLLIAIPIAELWVIVQISHQIGIIPTLLMLIAVSVAGAWLLKQQGMATWRRLQDTLHRGEIPTREATDGALILLGGSLLLTPGFLTDVVGLILLLPPTRNVLKGAVRRLLGRWARRRWGVATRVYDARAYNVRRTSVDSETPETSSTLPPGDTRSSSAGSRDRG